jgi:hypothetical protein
MTDSLPLLTGEAVRVTREHTGRDTCHQVEGAEEHHPDDESYAGDLRGHRLNPAQQHPDTSGDEGCEDELGHVDEDPLVRLVRDSLEEVVSFVRMDQGWH